MLTLLLLGPITRYEGLSQHLDLLDHRPLFEPLQVVFVLAEVGLVLGCDLSEQLFHQVVILLVFLRQSSTG